MDSFEVSGPFRSLAFPFRLNKALNGGRTADQKPLWQRANYLWVFFWLWFLIFFVAALLLLTLCNIHKQYGVLKMTALMAHPRQ